MSFVADNSVVVGWFIDSQSDVHSRELLDRAATEDVHVPGIWRTEFASVLLVFSHKRRLKPSQVPLIIEHIESLELVEDASPPSLRILIDLARRHALGAYDAAYLELALRLRLPLAARDGPLRVAASRAGILVA